MQISEGKIGARELQAVIVFTLAMKATDTTPDLITMYGRNAGWLLVLFSFLIMLIPMFVLMRLLKKHNTGLTDLLRKLTGTWGSSLIIALFLISFTSETFISSRGYVDIVNTMFFPLTRTPILYFLIMFFSFLVAKRGFESLGRTSWMLFGLAMSVGLLLLVLTWSEVNWDQLFPIAGPGFLPLLWHGVRYVSIYGEVMLMAFLFPYVTSYQNFRSGTWLGFGLSGFLIVLFNAWYVLIFDYPAIANIAYPYQQVTRAATIGITPTHLEALFLCIWIMAAVLHFAISLYICTYLFARLFRIHEFEPLILPLAGLILFLGILQHNVIVLNHLRGWLIAASSWLFIGMPFLLWLIDSWKERAK